MNKKEDFKTSIVVDQSPAEVFSAINNVRGWWQGDINGTTEKAGEEFTYEMKPYHFTRQRITESLPGKKIVWLVTESEINFVENKKEWLGTKIIFDIVVEGNKTRINFTHQGLVPAIECFGGCSGAWENLIQKSLTSLIQTGRGVEVF